MLISGSLSPLERKQIDMKQNRQVKMKIHKIDNNFILYNLYIIFSILTKCTVTGSLQKFI